MLALQVGEQLLLGRAGQVAEHDAVEEDGQHQVARVRRIGVAELFGDDRATRHHAFAGPGRVEPGTDKASFVEGRGNLGRQSAFTVALLGDGDNVGTAELAHPIAQGEHFRRQGKIKHGAKSIW